MLISREKQRLVLNPARNKKMRNLDDHLICLFLGRFEPALAAASFILDQGKALIQDNLGKQSIGLSYQAQKRPTPPLTGNAHSFRMTSLMIQTAGH